MWVVDFDLAHTLTTVSVFIVLFAKPLQVSCVFDVLSFFLICIVFALSFLRVKQRFHAGPRIFAINLLAFDLLCTSCSFVENLRLANVKFLVFSYELAIKSKFGT